MKTIKISTGNATPPGLVTTLTASQFIGGTNLSWVLPGDRDIEFVEVYRAQSNDLNKSIVVGKSYSTVFQDITASGTYYYWVRCVNTSGVKGSFFPEGNTNGIAIATYLGSSLGTSFPVGDFGNFASLRDPFDPNILTGPQFDCMMLDGATLIVDLGDVHPDVALGDFGSFDYDPSADILAVYDWGSFSTLDLGSFHRDLNGISGNLHPNVALGDFGSFAFNSTADILEKYDWGGFTTVTLTRDLGSV